MITFHITNPFDSYCENMPALIHLAFNNETLPTSVRVVFESLENDQRAECVFEDVEGFRVLDEGDMMEFWDERSRSQGWLWEIQKGVWLDLEIDRQSAITLKTLPKGLKEYLIAGSGKCLNILCYSEPKVTLINSIF